MMSFNELLQMIGNDIYDMNPDGFAVLFLASFTLLLIARPLLKRSCAVACRFRNRK